MQIISSLTAIKQQVDAVRSSGKQIGFVPTMGALHAGHLTLLQTAAKENDVTVCSIFVNPTQFNNPEDFKLYPRLLTEDTKLLEEQGCDILFAPEAQEMYPQPLGIKFDFGALETVMEGKFRPGHFSGVAAVVSKLFNLVKPHNAYFGQKDLQQFAIINRLVTDLNFDLNLICHPIIREKDGLAMSSRNRRLNAEQREVAAYLYKALEMAQELLPAISLYQIKNEIKNYLKPFELIQLEYFEIADVNTLQPLDILPVSKPVALCIAAFVGEVRLIDNIVVEPKHCKY